MSESENEPLMSAGDAIAIPSTVTTVVPRYIAAVLDNCVAMPLAVVAATSVSSIHPVLQSAALVIAYLSYFVFEALFSRTPGKLLTESR